MNWSMYFVLMMVCILQLFDKRPDPTCDTGFVHALWFPLHFFLFINVHLQRELQITLLLSSMILCYLGTVEEDFIRRFSASSAAHFQLSKQILLHSVCHSYNLKANGSFQFSVLITSIVTTASAFPLQTWGPGNPGILSFTP